MGDREKQLTVALRIAVKWGCDHNEFPTHSRADFLFSRGGMAIFIAEVKCRSKDMNTYPDYMISEHKILDGIMLSKMLHIPFLIIVSWKDKLAYFEMTESWYGNADVVKGGRTDRGDKKDIEPVVLIPIEEFKVILWGKK